MCLLRRNRTGTGAKEVDEIRFTESEPAFGETQIFGGHLRLFRCGGYTLAGQRESMLRFGQTSTKLA